MSIDYDKLVVVSILIIVLSFIGACTYTINIPSDIDCTKITQLKGDKYSLLNCTNNFSEVPQNIILTIRHEEK